MALLLEAATRQDISQAILTADSILLKLREDQVFWAGFQVICVISLFMAGFVAVLCLHYESEIKSFCRLAKIKKLLEKRQ